MSNSEKNTLKNEIHYDKKYNDVDIQYILKKLKNVDLFMKDATQTDTSWVGLYHGKFQDQLKGKKVLELGCGDCTNAAIMSAFGAEVYANDISQKPGEIIGKLNANHKFYHPIKFVHGDFLKSSEIPDNFFDIVIGKAFVHHLTYDQEIQFTKKIVSILKPNGIVRYFEPAVNNKFLDSLRWMTPVPGRPSKLQSKKFAQWKLEDPHPERDNSSKNYEDIGKEYFEEINITFFGSIERFNRILPKKYRRKFRRLAFRLEEKSPKILNKNIARSQLIEYKKPRK